LSGDIFRNRVPVGADNKALEIPRFTFSPFPGTAVAALELMYPLVSGKVRYMKSSLFRLAGLGLAGLLSVLLVTCSGGGGGTSTKGTVALALKDAPITTSDGRPADELNIEILRIQLEHSGEDTQAEEDAESQDDDNSDNKDDEVTVFDVKPGSGIKVNLLALDVPMILTMAKVPPGTYEQVELRLNPANATIHFTDDGSTVPVVVDREAEDEAELEFEFSPPLIVSSSGNSTAIIDFAPVVVFDGTSYLLQHDHDNDETGATDDETEVEVEGSFVRRNGDVLTIDVNGDMVQVDISGAMVFELNDNSVTKDELLAALTQGVEFEAEGALMGEMVVASKAEAGDSD
jgi:hypothetical protein